MLQSTKTKNSICSMQNIKNKTMTVSHSFRSAMMLARQHSHAASGWRPFLQSKKKKN